MSRKGEKKVIKRDQTGLRLFPLILILVSLLACNPSGNEPDSWDELLKRQHQELTETAKAVDQLASKLPDRLSNLQKTPVPAEIPI